MSEQMSLDEAFAAHPASVAKARRERDRALRLVEEHADPDWKDEALEAVRRTAQRMPHFHVDSVWEAGLSGTVENRALGAVLQRAARLGWIERTNEVRPSVRSHLSPKPLWRSLIYQGELP